MIEELQMNNTIVGYMNGKAIVMDEWDNVYYCTMPKEYVTIGEIVFSKDLHPISDLPESEQHEVRKMIAEL